MYFSSLSLKTGCCRDRWTAAGNYPHWCLLIRITHIEQYMVKAAFYTRHAVCKTSQASPSFASSMHFRHVFFFLLIPNICPVAWRQKKKKSLRKFLWNGYKLGDVCDVSLQIFFTATINVTHLMINTSSKWFWHSGWLIYPKKKKKKWYKPCFTIKVLQDLMAGTHRMQKYPQF